MPLMPPQPALASAGPADPAHGVSLHAPFRGEYGQLDPVSRKLLRTTVSVEELEAHHPRLRELNNWYRDHVESLGIQTFVYYEKLPTTGLLVVDETTANPASRASDPSRWMRITARFASQPPKRPRSIVG